MTNPPPVAPVEGHYARLRNGDVIGPMQKALTNRALWTATASALFWTRYGRLNERHFYDEYDIIATISPADMQAVASGELERLRAALHKAQIEREYWRGFAVQTKQQVEGFVKKLQDWTNEGELIQGGYNAST